MNPGGASKDRDLSFMGSEFKGLPAPSPVRLGGCPSGATCGINGSWPAGRAIQGGTTMLTFYDRDQTWNRRAFLKVGSLALGGLSLPGLIEARGLAAEARRVVTDKS